MLLPVPDKPLFQKGLRLAQLVAKYCSVQVVVQLIGAVIGLLLTNVTTVQEYAFYTMANALQSTLLALADTGLTAALSASVGKHWQDPYRLGQVVQSGLEMRKTLAGIALIFVVPFIAWTFMKNNVPPFYAVLLGVSLLAGAGARMTTDIYSMVLKIKGKVSRLQQLDLIGAIFRIVLIGILYFFTINALLAVTVGSATFFLQNVFLRRWVREDIVSGVSANKEDTAAIWAAVRGQVVNTLYYCAQGPISLFVISQFGKTANIAELGALGRIGAIFGVVSAVFANIVMPRFAREQNFRRLAAIYLGSIAALTVFSVGLAAVVLSFPGPILSLLGSNYTHLQPQLGYTVLATVISSFTGLLFGLNAARAWFRHLWITIPIVIVVQGWLAYSLDLSSVNNVILLTCIPYGISCVVPLYVAVVEIMAIKEQNERSGDGGGEI